MRDYVRARARARIRVLINTLLVQRHIFPRRAVRAATIVSIVSSSQRYALGNARH